MTEPTDGPRFTRGEDILIEPKEWVKESPRVWSGVVAAIAAIATIFVAISTLFFSFQSRYAATQSEAAYSQARTQKEAAERSMVLAENTRQEVEQLRKESSLLRAEIDQASKSGRLPRYAELSPADRQAVGTLKSSQDQLQQRIAALENALLNTPEKALSVPLLKQQVDALQDHTHGDIEAVRGEVGRLFGLTQWFIGLMFTIALGVLGLALNNLRRPASEKEPKKA